MSAVVALEGGPSRELWPGLAGVLEAASGQPLNSCYQCHKCSGGCPAVEFMDFAPSQVVRLAQFGLAQELLASASIWTCTGCHTCGLRCPNGIDVGELMDVLKGWHLAGNEPGVVKAARGGAPMPPPAEKRTVIFHRLFLGGVRRLGRMHELALMGMYKLLSGDLFSDLGSGMKMLALGKLPLLPHLRPERREVAAMFERAAIVSRRYERRAAAVPPPGSAKGGAAR